MRVIGTAGHVDHGKSTLVQALTGIHPDRLKEEQEREMTIDLGFAWLTLADGEEVGVVDVPGHRDFIENMLAGIGGIDAVLFVVAADEGVMPQTREHLAIIDLLQINGGIVAITKTDLVDPDWLELVEDDLHQQLAGTILADSPINRVSGKTGEGIDRLRDSLTMILSRRPPRTDYQRPRLPIDRVFSIAGFGTVVTGTLSDGQFRKGDDVEILPKGTQTRIRGLQTHKQQEEIAVPGSRTAINISGISTDQVLRGDVVTHPGDYKISRRLDVRFRLLPDVTNPIKHNIETKFFIGSSEILARVRLLGSKELLPGETGWLQLETQEPVVAIRGDRFILRRPSPGETLGGGSIVDPHPHGRYKRFSQETIVRLEALHKGSDADVVLQTLNLLGAANLQEVIDNSNLGEENAIAAAEELLYSKKIIALELGAYPTKKQNTNDQTQILKSLSVTTVPYWKKIREKFLDEIKTYHGSYPLRPGMPREELKSRTKSILRSSNQLFNLSVSRLVTEKEIIEIGPLVSIHDHEIVFSPDQENQVSELIKRYHSSPYSPPSVKESRNLVGEGVFSALAVQGKVVLVSEEVAFLTEDYDHMVNEVKNLLQKESTISAAQVRDHFGTSRKYTLALLEHLDRERITIREGDVRRLK